MSEATVVFKTFELDTADGKKRTLKRPTLGVEKVYARYLEKRNLEAINRQKADLGPIGYELAINGSNGHIPKSGVQNHFGWLRPGFIESISDAENVAHLLWAWIVANYKDPKDDLYVAGQSDMYRLYLANREACERLLNEVLEDPNPLLPE